ncbi:MAG: hypothetical protein QOD72_2192, partial [Acidimicrobiaceae bacterium]|nr:hypothetical protein [Acidimicrobiaceae bacterium]
LQVIYVTGEQAIVLAARTLSDYAVMVELADTID